MEYWSALSGASLRSGRIQKVSSVKSHGVWQLRRSAYLYLSVIWPFVVILDVFFFPQFLQCDASRLPLAWDCEEDGSWNLTPTWNWCRPLLPSPGCPASSGKAFASACASTTVTTAGGAAGSWWTWGRSQKVPGGLVSLTPVHEVRAEFWEAMLSA